MTQDLALRRRAIYTGLKPYLEEDALLDALMHWENHFSSAPRFTLQRFVAELCQNPELRSRRADMLLSLVQALSMPASSLLPDPLQHRSKAAAAGGSTGAHAAINDSSGFVVLMTALFENMTRDVQYHLRLDMLASLDPRRLPRELLANLQRWLGDKDILRPLPADNEVLRSLVNRCYVLLCERIGPVEADRLLARATEQAQQQQPTLKRAIAQLL